MGLFGLLGRGRHERAGFELYGRAVAAARAPVLYAVLGVPDTLDGRFDMVSLHAFLLIRRLRGLKSPGPALAQAVFDAMFNDMDVTLREMGVGDLGVGRRVKSMWEGFHGRASAYQTALDSGDRIVLTEALARNVWRNSTELANARPLAGLVMAQDRHLAEQSVDAMARGVVDFLSAETGLAA